MTCLITGCALVDLANGKWVHGDLHKIGHNYVFNACLENGETAWQDGEVSAETKQVELDIQILRDNQIFERRGIITFPALWCRLNDVAKAYLGKMPT